MKIIDLLNKIANGEEVPKKIKYNNIDYFWCNQCKIYERFDDDSKDLYNDLDNLNDEIEILEEKKIPEKLPLIANTEVNYPDDEFLQRILNLFYELNNKNRLKINEIIDYLQSKGDE